MFLEEVFMWAWGLFLWVGVLCGGGKMSRIHVKSAPENTEQAKIMSLFPKVKPSEKTRFVELHDNETLVHRKAQEFRQADKKYAVLENDYDVCVYYLEEKYRNSIRGNIKATGEGLGGLLAFFAKQDAWIIATGSKLSNAIQEHPDVIVDIFGNIVPPTLSLYDNEDGENNILPRDEKSICEVKNILNEVGLPETITNSAGDCLNEGVSIKSIYALVATGFSWYTTKKEVGAKGLKPNKFATQGHK